MIVIIRSIKDYDNNYIKNANNKTNNGKSITLILILNIIAVKAEKK